MANLIWSKNPTSSTYLYARSYFKPKHQNIVKEKKWTDKERRLLIKGIQKYGIGNWKQIREEFLSEWVTTTNYFIPTYLKEYTELRVKTSSLVGRQSLKLYKGWKGDEEDIQREYKLNYQIGMEFNAWKGVLVNDEQGKVLQRITELANKRKT